MSRENVITLPTLQAKLRANTWETERVNIAWLGSSTTQGSNASDQVRRYHEVLTDMLRRNIGADANIHRHISMGAEPWRFTITGTYSTGTEGLGMRSRWLDAGSTANIMYGFTKMTLMFGEGQNHGSFTYTLNGGSPVTVTPDTSSTSETHTGRVVIDAESYGVHTVIITSTTGMRLCGAIMHIADDDLGICSFNGGLGGTTSNDFATNTLYINHLNALQPCMIGVMLGSNDYAYSMNPTTYQANLQTIVDLLRNGITCDFDILFIHGHYRFDVTSPLAPWEDYGATMQSVASQNERCYFVNVSRFYPKTAALDAANLVSDDNIHMTDAGHSLTARVLRGSF